MNWCAMLKPNSRRTTIRYSQSKNTTSAHDAANAIKTFTLAHHHRIDK